MFSYEEIQKYNETDIRIYKYIVSNIDKIQYMTIRELAKELQVSTSTILRFCNNNITAALIKKLIYQQGMMDLLDLLLGGKEFDICNNH